MSHEMTFSDAGNPGDIQTFALCSTGAWGKFRQWAEGLPLVYPHLKDLAEHGEVEDTLMLGGDLRDALGSHPPDEGVRSTVAAILDKLGVGGERERLVVTA